MVKRVKPSDIFVALQMLVILFVFLAPILWALLASFEPTSDVTRYPPTLVFVPTLDNYRELFFRTDFLRNTLNSFIVAGGATALGLVLGVPAAFAISWHRLVWPATATMFARMAPGTLFLVPWFIMSTKLGINGTYWVLILANAVITLPVAIWTLLPSFDQVPREIVESAQMDGCNPVSMLGRVLLPLVAPGLVVAGVLCFVYSWNYFLFVLVLSDSTTKTAVVAAFNFIGEASMNWGALMAAGVMIALPPIVLMGIVQRRLVSGLMYGAVKG